MNFVEKVESRAAASASVAINLILQARQSQSLGRSSVMGSVVSANVDVGSIELTNGQTVTGYAGFRPLRTDDKVAVIGRRVFP